VVASSLKNADQQKGAQNEPKNPHAARAHLFQARFGTGLHGHFLFYGMLKVPADRPLVSGAHVPLGL
jgi:hypothetical protein